MYMIGPIIHTGYRVHGSPDTWWFIYVQQKKSEIPRCLMHMAKNPVDVTVYQEDLRLFIVYMVGILSRDEIRPIPGAREANFPITVLATTSPSSVSRRRQHAAQFVVSVIQGNKDGAIAREQGRGYAVVSTPSTPS